MWSLFRTALALSLCALLANCSLFWKSETEKEEELARFQDYYPSDVYKDIQTGDEEDRSTASYEDDDYAAADEDPAAASQDDEQNAYLDKEIDKEDQGMVTADMGEDPLDYQPVEPSTAVAEEPQAIKPVAKAWPTKFKNKMHKFSKKCHMRSGAKKGAQSVGKVSIKRKLWVENHNADWVVVQRKAGPAYIHKSCL